MRKDPQSQSHAAQHCTVHYFTGETQPNVVYSYNHKHGNWTHWVSDCIQWGEYMFMIPGFSSANVLIGILGWTAVDTKWFCHRYDEHSISWVSYCQVWLFSNIYSLSRFARLILFFRRTILLNNTLCTVLDTINIFLYLWSLYIWSWNKTVPIVAVKPAYIIPFNFSRYQIFILLLV